jgi:hypothetical protein
MQSVRPKGFVSKLSMLAGPVSGRVEPTDRAAAIVRAAARVSVAVLEELEGRTLFSTFFVTTGQDEDSGGNPVAGSLRAAIVSANATPGSTIDFSQLPANTPITLSASLESTPITASGTIIDGTTAPGGRVIIDGASFDGLDVTSNNSSGTGTIQGLWLRNMGTALLLDGAANEVVQNNYIGDVDGTGMNKNLLGIVLDDGAEDDTIGGVGAADRNVIGGNANSAGGGAGIVLQDTQGIGTNSNEIENNYIGVDPAGTSAAPNNTGILLGDSFGNVIQSNVISGNTLYGINAIDPAQDGEEYSNAIISNIIGMDESSVNPISNGEGIFMNGGVLAGGSAIETNTIADNTGIGIEINEGSLDQNLGLISGGDYVKGNTIDDNGGTGVVIDTDAENNTITQNSIYGNDPTGTNLGIDLGDDGVTQNSTSSGTTLTGANGLTPFPVLGSITPDSQDSTMLTVPFSLQANPSTSYTIEIFSDAPADASTSGYGQGQTYITSATVTTDITGAVTGSVNISASLYAGDSITATSTNSTQYSATTNPDAGATSEFSKDVVAPGTALPDVTIRSASGAVGSNIVFPITLSSISNTATTMTYTFSPGTAPLSDITGTTGTVTIPAGATTANLSVPVIADSTGANETFTVTLSSLSTNALFSNNQTTESATGTILSASSGTTASTTTLTASPTTGPAGTSVLLTAKVTGGTAAPTGTVTFLDGGTIIGTSSVGASGTATLSTSSLPVGSDTITAVYSGNTTYATSTSNAVTVTITGTTQKSSTTTLVATPTSGGLGTSITLTATVTGTGGTPTGTVTFSNNGVTIGSAAVNGSGRAVLTLTTLPVGTNGLTATYLGSGAFTSSTSASTTVIITATGTDTSVTTLIASPTSAPLGSSITLTATVASSVSGGVVPTGTVTFNFGGSAIGTGTLDSGGQATLTITTLPQGSDTVTASYTGDSTYASSVSTGTIVIITQPLTATTITLAASASTVAFGNPVTLTATVAHSTGSATPTGTVTFIENGVELGSATLSAGGLASLTLSTLTAGSNSITASYSGDTNYLYSGSTHITVLVTSTATTSLSISTNAVIVTGTKVVLSTTVASATAGGATPTGTVSFYQNGSILLGTVQLQSDGTASLVSSALGLGTDSITAVYGGEPAYPTSTSPTVRVTVLSSPNVVATVTTTVSLMTVVGNTVTVTSTVSPTATGAATPTGTVSFFTNGTLIGTATLQSNGTAVLSTSALAVGNNTITAVYNGNSVYTASSPGTATAFVNTLGLVPAITKSTLPSALIAGTLTHGTITVTLTNVTLQLIREPQTTIHLYASADGTLDASSVLVQQWFTSVKLKAGKVETFHFKVNKLPVNLASGTYTLMLRVSNTVGTFGYFFAGPRVTVTAARIGLTASVAPVNLPSTLVSGDNNGGAVQLVLTNTGNFASSGAITIELTASPTAGQLGTSIRTVVINTTISPGNSRTVTIPLGTLPMLAAGSYHIVAQLTDPLGVNSIVSSATTVAIATSFNS